MGFVSRKGISYKTLFSVICFLWLCGSDRVPNSFKIYRSKHDIFTNLKCSSHSCIESQCEMYGAECVKSSNCKYCRCSKDERNTFMISNYHHMNGECKRDEDIVPESVPNKRFWLKNENRDKCLKLQTTVVAGTSCSSFTLDMLWIWTNTRDKQLMNIKTLECMERPDRNEGEVIMMKTCDNTSVNQNMKCTEDINKEIMIGWEKNPKHFLHLKRKAPHNAIYKENSKQRWSSNETGSCSSTITYAGCYRFSDGSFMKYIYYGDNDTNLHISAPIFTGNNGNCKVTKLKFTRNGQIWETTENNFPISIKTIDSNTRKLQFNRTELFKAFNGSLLKLFVACGKEKHCVLLKLESKPNYSEVINSTPTPPITTSTEDASTLSSETSTEYDKDTTPVTKYSGGTTVITFNSQSTREDSREETSTTANPEKGLREEASESGGTNTAAIAVPVTLLLIALVLALGFLVYYRRRKRAQGTQNSNNDTGVVNYSKEIYEDPERTYETLKENENGVPCNQPGITSDTYTNPDNIMFNPTPSEQEYSYAKNTDFPRSSVGTKPEAKRLINNGVVYETLEQPGKPRDDDFYNYPDNTSIAKPPSSELEYTYAKDTDFPRSSVGTKPEAKRPINNGVVYETLEQPGKPRDDDFYNYPDNTNIAKPPSSELEYTYAKDTDFPRCNPNTKLPASQDPEKNAVYETLEQPGQPADDDFYSYPENTDIAKPPSSELEYSYAKNTEIPKLDEQSPPQPPVYSTLEGPDDGDNKQVTEERPSSNNHAYIDVIHDSNN